jgi:hypothetical protein
VFPASVALSLVTLPFAATGGLDWTSAAAMLLAIAGLLTSLTGIWNSRHPRKRIVDEPEEVTQLIRLVQDLERAKDERDALSLERDQLRADALRMHDEIGRLTRELRRYRDPETP